MNYTRLLHAVICAGMTSALTLAPAHAASCRVQSLEQTVALIELYTSEGCSSCPPADRWLGELEGRYGAQYVLPLALHVDYWDYIGWKDMFAQAAFSERQRRLSQFGSTGTIYTPEVFVGMKELRGWHSNETLANRIKQINRQAARAGIEIQMQSNETDSADVEVQFAADDSVDGPRNQVMARGIVVIFENKLSTAVRAGENKGARLNHDHVVRFWSAPTPLDAKTGRATWRQTVPLPSDWKRENLGVAAFVENAATGEVLQAVSLPGCV